MRTRIAALGLLFAGFASMAFGQYNQLFQLTGGESPQMIQEMVNVVRSTGDIVQIAPDAAHQSMTVSGTVDQLAIAAWVISQLDHPAKSGDLTYIPPGASDSVVQIFYLAQAGTPRQVQEMVNIIRSVTEIVRITAYNSSHAVILRGTQAQAALAGWIVKGLDIPPGQTLDPIATPVGFAPGEVAQIFYLTHGEPSQQVQGIINIMRSLGDIQRLTAYDTLSAIVMRAPTNKAAAAAWLVTELDKPGPQAAAEHSYQIQGLADGAVRVFYVPAVQSADGLQQLIKQVRAAAPITRIAADNAVAALAMRATPDQIATAEQVIRNAKL